MTEKNTEADPAAAARRAYRRRQLYLRGGQALMIVGALMAFIHWLAHIEAFGPGQPEGWVDLAVGYPMGVLLLITGAILAGRKPA